MNFEEFPGDYLVLKIYMLNPNLKKKKNMDLEEKYEVYDSLGLLAGFKQPKLSLFKNF